jgi:hypothetical protein
MNRLLAALAVMVALAIVSSDSKANTGMVFSLAQVKTVVECNSDSNVARTYKDTGYVIYESNVAPLEKIYLINTYTRKGADGVTRKYYNTPDPMLFELVKSTLGTKMMWVLTYDNANNHVMFTGPEKTVKMLGEKVLFPAVISGYWIWEDTEGDTTELGESLMTLKFNATETIYGYMHGNSAAETRNYLVDKLEAKGYVNDN